MILMYLKLALPSKYASYNIDLRIQRNSQIYETQKHIL